MEYLHILKIGENKPMSRVEVAVLGRETIHGVECFFHSDGKNICVTHLESGGLIAADPSSTTAVAMAKFRLSDARVWENRLAHVRTQILEAGHLYPVNPVPA